MSQTSHDARAVVRALDALTTQVRRIADALTTTPDVQPTTADDGPHCVCGDPIQLTGDPAYWIHSPGSDTPCTDARPKLPPMDPVHILGAEAPAADEDAQRTTRRNSAAVLLARAVHGVLTPDEGGELRKHVNAEIREADTARTRAEQAEELLRVAHETSNRSEAERAAAVKRAEQADAVTAEAKRLLERRTKTLRERAERAEAAIERVRRVAALIEAGAPWTANQHETAGRILDALDGTEQPTTEA